MTQLFTQFKDDYQSLKSYLRFSYYEAFLTSFVIGIAESFFAAFSISKGMNTLESGLLTSLPLIFAAGFNVLLNVYFKPKTLSAHVQDNVLLQILSLVGLSYFAYIQPNSTHTTFIILLVLFSMYWYAFFSSQPVWNTWISEIITVDQSQDYFSLRTRLVQLGIISGLLLGGGLLQFGSDHQESKLIYVLLFSIAALSQVVRYHFFHKHQPSESIVKMSYKKITSLLKRNRIFYTQYSIFNFSLFISAPFIAGYLLRNRNLSYYDFMLVTMALFVGKIITTFITSQSQKDYNPQSLLILGGITAAPLPALWGFCYNLQTMILLQIVSGAAWALWELGISLSFFKNVQKSDKIETITTYHTIGIITQVLGVCIGAMLAKYIFNRNYDQLFIFAGVVRLLCMLPFLKNKTSLS